MAAAAADGAKNQQQQQQQQQQQMPHRGQAANVAPETRGSPTHTGNRDDPTQARPRSRSPGRTDSQRVELDDHSNGSVEEQEPEKNKVFVGNLSYGIAEQDLEAYFAQIGKVLNATIVKRRGRPVGFGFVTFESEEVAQRAVSTLDQTTCDGRLINVEVTASRPRKPRGEGKPRRNRRPRRRATDNVKAEGSPQDAEARAPRDWDENKPANDNGNEGAPPRRPRARRERKPRNSKPQVTEEWDQSQEAVGEAVGEAGAEKQERVKRRRQRNRKRGSSIKEGDAAAGESQAAEGNRPARAPRAPRAPRSQKGEPSDRTIFVANLPFTMGADELRELFSGYNTDRVRVIQRRGSKRNKGFGFVEMADHDEQERAINELQGDSALQVDGRVLTIKVALVEIDSQGADDDAAESSPSAPAPARIDE